MEWGLGDNRLTRQRLNRQRLTRQRLTRQRLNRQSEGNYGNTELVWAACQVVVPVSGNGSGGG